MNADSSNGELPIRASAWQRFARAFGLAAKELLVAQLTYADRTRKQMAATLKVTIGTIHTHCARLHEKLGVHDRVAVIHRINSVVFRRRRR